MSQQIRLFAGDIRTSNQLPDSSADAVITSPPYNIGTAYDVVADRLAFDDYRVFLRTVIAVCHSKLRPGGLFAVNVADLVHGPYGTLFLPKLIEDEMLAAGLDYVGTNMWIKWSGSALDPSQHWEHGYFPTRTNYHSVTEWVMVFAKGELTFRPTIDEVWHIRRSVDKSTHPAAWSDDFCQRMLDAFTAPGAVVLDPFMGVGALARACASSGRGFIGFDVSKPYIAAAVASLKEVPDVEVDV